MSARDIRVLVVDDSPTVCLLLERIVSEEPGCRVVGIAHNGREALEWLRLHAADVVLMDVNMPEMDGFDATRRIMETHPLPIVVCSGTLSTRDVANTFRALEAGAVAFIGKPVGPEHADYADAARNVARTVRLMSEVRVVRRWRRPAARGEAGGLPSPANSAGGAGRELALVAIGASTGGPLALQSILANLPASFAAPILIVQHIAAGFVKGMVDWLAATSGPRVCLAAQGDAIRAGCVYVAPDGVQMGVDAEGRIALRDDPPERGLRPSVGYLFRSVARRYGPAVAGVLLTGMGVDGAEELLGLRAQGALTVVQNRETCVVFGMPGHALNIGAAMHELPPEGIAALLAGAVSRR